MWRANNNKLSYIKLCCHVDGGLWCMAALMGIAGESCIWELLTTTGLKLYLGCSGAYAGGVRGGSLEPPFWQASKHCSLHIRLAFHAPASTWAFVYHLNFQITHAGGRPLTILMVTIAINGIKVGVAKKFHARFTRIDKIEPPFKNSCIRSWLWPFLETDVTAMTYTHLIYSSSLTYPRTNRKSRSDSNIS